MYNDIRVEEMADGYDPNRCEQMESMLDAECDIFEAIDSTNDGFNPNRYSDLHDQWLNAYDLVA
jgi:hypothetical protein